MSQSSSRPSRGTLELPEEKSRKKKLSYSRRNPPKTSSRREERSNGEPTTTVPLQNEERPGRSEAQKLQSQVEQVVDIMRSNTISVLERDGKLADLESRVENMREGSKIFHERGKGLVEKARDENKRMKKYCIAITVIFAALILIVIGYFVFNK